MKKKKPSMKLTLSKETLRNLSTETLGLAVGGITCEKSCTQPASDCTDYSCAIACTCTDYC